METQCVDDRLKFFSEHLKNLFIVTNLFFRRKIFDQEIGKIIVRGEF